MKAVECIARLCSSTLAAPAPLPQAQGNRNADFTFHTLQCHTQSHFLGS